MANVQPTYLQCTLCLSQCKQCCKRGKNNHFGSLLLNLNSLQYFLKTIICSVIINAEFNGCKMASDGGTPSLHINRLIHYTCWLILRQQKI